MRVKLNDIGSSNGEFIFFFDDQLKVHLTDMSNMVPDETFEISHARFYVFNNWPGTQNDGSFYFKNYYLTGFSSDVSTPNVYTTEAPVDDTQTTHPITTTAQPGTIPFLLRLKSTPVDIWCSKCHFCLQSSTASCDVFCKNFHTRIQDHEFFSCERCIGLYFIFINI